MNLSLNEATDHGGSESSTLEMDVHVWCYTLLVVLHASNERMIVQLIKPCITAMACHFAVPAVHTRVKEIHRHRHVPRSSH